MKKRPKKLAINKETLSRLSGGFPHVENDDPFSTIFTDCPPPLPPEDPPLIGSLGASCYGSQLRPCCHTQTCGCLPTTIG